ncbi:MAG TPA: ABC transporter permease [Bacteroidota bacterium]|nr:ABC transporter permease [Bacteroidota bacterium]
MMDALFTLAFLIQIARISIPYALPALGATFSERGGVVNIALEGILLVSAFATTAAAFVTGSPMFGILCGVCAGILTALLHGVICVTLKADQIVSGIAVNLFAVGITKFSCQLLFNSSSNSARIAGTEQWTFLAAVPVLKNPFLIITGLLVVASHILLFRTKFGLRLRAVGEHPEAADSLGVNVARLRYAGLMMCGGLTGLAGAWLAVDQHSFTDGMSAGRGFIALAAMIIGKWTPLGALCAALLFGFAESLTIQLESASRYLQLLQMTPYVLTMVVLAGFIGRSTAPASVGIPYEKEAI